MNLTGLYIIVSVIVLLIIALSAFFTGNKKKRLTPTAGLAFSFVIAGIVFGDSRLIGYSLIAIGVILALTDIFNRSKTSVKLRI